MLSKLRLDPDTVHYLFVFPVFDYPIKVLALYCLKTNRLENILDLFNGEVVGPGFVKSSIEVFLNFGCSLLCKSQLCQIVKSIVSKVQYCILFKLIENFLRNKAVFFWGDGRKNEN
jgi:hypothetical protein